MNAIDVLFEGVSHRYCTQNQRSHRLWQQLCSTLPGGDTRSITFYRPFPVAVDYGSGPYLFDVDGHRYIDVLNNYTALVHGHAFGPITSAVRSALTTGSAFPAPTELLADFAAHLVSRYPAAERMRLTNSGTEAAILALRIARHATGRRRVLLFEGAYHGAAPPFTGDDPEVVRVRYNDGEAVRASLDAGIAAVFAEPFLGSAGVIPAESGFLDEVGRCARRAGAVFVLDEVQSARNAFGGEHASLLEPPDLILLGKAAGGGLPVGVVAGKGQLMMLTAPESDGIAHSGTFNANPLTLAAGLASLLALDEGAIALLNQKAEYVAAGIGYAGVRAGIPLSVTRSGSIMQVHLRATRPTDAAEAAETSSPLVALMHLSLMAEGIYAAPRGMLNLSTVMTDEHIEVIVGAYHRVLQGLGALDDTALYAKR